MFALYVVGALGDADGWMVLILNVRVRVWKNEWLRVKVIAMLATDELCKRCRV